MNLFQNNTRPFPVIASEVSHNLHLTDVWSAWRVEGNPGQLLELEHDPFAGLSSDKRKCFDSVGPFTMIHGSPFTPHNKQGCLNSSLWPGQGLVNHYQRSNLEWAFGFRPDVRSSCENARGSTGWNKGHSWNMDIYMNLAIKSFYFLSFMQGQE